MPLNQQVLIIELQNSSNTSSIISQWLSSKHLKYSFHISLLDGLKLSSSKETTFTYFDIYFTKVSNGKTHKIMQKVSWIDTVFKFLPYSSHVTVKWIPIYLGHVKNIRHIKIFILKFISHLMVNPINWKQYVEIEKDDGKWSCVIRVLLSTVPVRHSLPQVSHLLKGAW